MSKTSSNAATAEIDRPDRSGRTIGFAFGGVAGFNAYNAGVLQAIVDYKQIEPAIITCTSGAMWWVYKYLKLKNGQSSVGLREELGKQVDGEKGFNNLTLAAFGLPGIFSPAIIEYIHRWCKPWPTDAMNPFTSAFTIPWSNDYWQQPFMTEVFNRLWPAQWFVPTRPESEFADMVTTLSDPAAPPILFNAYDFRNGREIVYGNQQALGMINIKDRPFRNKITQERERAPYCADVPQTEYRLMGKESIEEALWLVWYGLAKHGHIDGAYRRQIILSELTMCDKIYIVKPEPCKISNGDEPKNYFEVQDLQTEMWLNSAYDTEVADLSNHAARHAHKRLLNQVNQPTKSNFDIPRHEPDTIELVPISREHTLGYFNYFFERLENFNDAYRKALNDFNGIKRLTPVRIYTAIA